MIALAKLVSTDFSLKDLKYPDITIPEQGLKRKEWQTQKLWCILKWRKTECSAAL